LLINETGIRPELLDIAPRDMSLRSILISFCNVWPFGHTLALLDCETGSFRWVPANRQSPLMGTNGIRPCPGGYAMVEHLDYGGVSQIATLGPDLTLLEERTVDGITDAHDVEILDEGALAIVASAHDRVVRVDRNGDVSVIFAASETMTDTQHVNSVAAMDGRLFATAFGPKPQDGWRFAQDGYIVDCESGEKVHEGIRHPHSLSAVDGRLWWCESATSRVWSWGASDGARVEATLKGYLRGLLVTPDLIICAASARRDASRLHGVGIPIPNPEKHVDGSWLYLVDRRTGQAFARRIDHIGGEIFAIAAAPLQVERPTAQETAAALAQRIGTAQRLAAEADQVIRQEKARLAAEAAAAETAQAAPDVT
jgi:hypothetical protein